MNGRNDDIDDDTDYDDDNDDENLDDDAMPDIGGETMVDVSSELDDDDADELIRVSTKPDPAEAARRREVRRRLEDIAEQRREKLDDTFNFNLDDDF
jgi:hypothetical protein